MHPYLWNYSAFICCIHLVWILVRKAIAVLGASRAKWLSRHLLLKVPTTVQQRTHKQVWRELQDSSNFSRTNWSCHGHSRIQVEKCNARRPLPRMFNSSCRNHDSELRKPALLERLVHVPYWNKFHLCFHLVTPPDSSATFNTTSLIVFLPVHGVHEANGPIRARTYGLIPMSVIREHHLLHLCGRAQQRFESNIDFRSQRAWKTSRQNVRGGTNSCKTTRS